MAEPNNHPPGVLDLIRKFAVTSIGALQNRAELLVVEWQEERARLAEVFVWAAAFMFFAVMAVAMLTVMIIFVFPEHLRIYAILGFTVMYLLAAVAVGYGLKALLKRDPFPETLDQARKDRAWLESLR